MGRILNDLLAPGLLWLVTIFIMGLLDLLYSFA